jgi:hypothetical protein
MDTPLSDTPENENELLPDDSSALQEDDQGETDWSQETPSDDRLSEEAKRRIEAEAENKEHDTPEE